MSKTCYNCLHKEKRGKEVPCNSCENVNGTPTNWQPEGIDENGLLPCPFCGCNLEKLSHYYIHPNSDCVIFHIAIDVDDKEGIEKWNIRAGK